MITPPAKCLRQPKNLGFGPNCNAAAKEAQGDLLCFVNSDIEHCPPDWGVTAILPMIRQIEIQDDIGIIGPKLLFPNGRIQSCGGGYDVGKGPYHRYLNHLSSSRYAADSCEVAWITGAFFLTPRVLFEQLGGLDPEYKRGYFEDVDYCEKVKRAGKKIWYCAESTFLHKVGQSTGGQKTDEEMMKASRSFRQNSVRFHKLWDSGIVSDVQSRVVPY